MAKASLEYNSIGQLPVDFWNKVNKTDDCWLWTGKIDDGYGRVYIKGTHYLVHRLMVAIMKEPVLPDMVIDHICKVRNCCNPDHLRQVTKSENNLTRKNNPDPTLCINGHPLFDEDSQTHISVRRTRKQGPQLSITCKLCNSVKRLVDTPVES